MYIIKWNILLEEVAHKILNRQSIFIKQQHPSFLNNNNKSMTEGVEFRIRQTECDSQSQPLESCHILLLQLLVSAVLQWG